MDRQTEALDWIYEDEDDDAPVLLCFLSQRLIDAQFDRKTDMLQLLKLCHARDQTMHEMDFQC